MSDEWISNDSIPIPGIEVEVKVQLHGEGFFITESSIIKDINFYCWNDKNLKKGKVTHWRPLQKKKPDFWKLNEGDFLILELIKNNEIEVFPCFFDKIDHNFYSSKCSPHDFYFYRSKGYGVGSSKSFGIGQIQKITRINLEKQTFEEI